MARLKARPIESTAVPVATDALRETNGITSRVVLLYVAQVAGEDGAERVLERCGMSDRRDDLLDENHWFSYDAKIGLFEAASDVLGDPNVMLSVSSHALALNVGGGLKLALRALGSPRLVYQNIVRANAKFSGSHSMELLDVGPRHAVISYADLTSARRYHDLDCQYNRGMLARVPELFGLGAAHVEHHICGCHGGPACIYSLRWESGSNEIRFALGAAAVGGGALAATAVFDPALLPVGAGVAGASAVAAAIRAARQERAVRRQLETDAREQSDLADRLVASLQDLVSELRLDEVLAKITQNAQAAVVGKEFALMVDDGDGPRCQSYTSLALSAVSILESWAQTTMARGEHPVTVDDVLAVPGLARLAGGVQPSFGSICAAPLVFRGSRLGVLVALATQPRTFLPRDVDLIQSYAALAAVALANARMYQELEELAARDHLTGLLNLREFHEALTRELERCKRYGGRFSVVLFDLNHFKAVNDSRGHAEGDRVLKEAGAAFAGTCRSSDLAFRVGGDEFAYILPESGADAAAAAARAREALAAMPEELDCCYGITVWPNDGPERAKLLETADSRLYEMKREHRPGGTAHVL